MDRSFSNNVFFFNYTLKSNLVNLIQTDHINQRLSEIKVSGANYVPNNNHKIMRIVFVQTLSETQVCNIRLGCNFENFSFFFLSFWGKKSEESSL